MLGGAAFLADSVLTPAVSISSAVEGLKTLPALEHLFTENKDLTMMITAVITCAESLVLKTGLPRYYLATMQVWDAECAARVEKHRKMRAQKQFETLECPLHLDRLALPGRGTVLLEDLGNLVANELYSPGGVNAVDLHELRSRIALWSGLFPF